MELVYCFLFLFFLKCMLTYEVELSPYQVMLPNKLVCLFAVDILWTIRIQLIETKSIKVKKVGFKRITFVC